MHKWLLALTLLFLAAPAAAQDVKGYPCFICTDAQMRTTAISQGVGTWYVYSLADRVTKWQVTSSSSATQLSPEEWVVDQFIAFSDLYLQTNGTLATTFAINLPLSRGSAVRDAITPSSGGSINAYDVTVSSQARNAIAQHLASNPLLSFTAKAATVGRVLRFEFLTTSSSPLTVNTNFPDGSRAVFKFNYDTKQWDYLPGSAVDSNGNTIPESGDAFAGNGYAEYGFAGPGPDLDRFLYQAAQAGIPVSGGYGFGGVTVACSKVGSATRCQIVAR